MRAVLLVAVLLANLAGHAHAREPRGLTVPAWRALPFEETGTRHQGVVEAPHQGVWLATIEGADTLLVNDTPFDGDGGGRGPVCHPVLLRAGTNTLVAANTRPSLRVTFEPPRTEILVTHAHATRGHPSVDAAAPLLVVVRLVNATMHTIRPVTIEASLVVGAAIYGSGTRLPALPPLAEAGVALSFPLAADMPKDAEALRLEVQVADCDAVLFEGALSVRLLTLGVTSPPREKPFSHVAGRDVVLVFGTSGTDEETEELLALARYDAQRWLGRPGRCVELVRDVDVLRRPRRIRDRPFVLYGSEHTNAVWAMVARYVALGPCASVGDREEAAHADEQ